jgi:hypothetical protein
MAQTKSEAAESHWSSVRKVVRKPVVDNFFEDYPTIAEFRKSMLNMNGSGSREIQVILQTSGGTAESFDKYDPLNKDPIDPIESAFYQRRYYAVPIILSDTENWENMGPERIFNLMKALGDNADSTLLKAINEDIYSAQAGKNMLGFQDVINASAGGTIGGIDSSVTTNWDNQRDTNALTFTSQTVTNIFDGVQGWNDINDLVAIQGGRVSHIFTTWSIAKAYREVVSSAGYARTELSNPGGVGTGSQGNPDFYGAKIIADNDCTALYSYHVDQRHAKLETLKQANFNKTPFVSLQSNGQLAQLAYKVASVQLSTNNRRRLGVKTALTGS